LQSSGNYFVSLLRVTAKQLNPNYMSEKRKISNWLKFKTIFHKLVPKCPDTSAKVSYCLTDNLALVPKCSWSEVS